VRAAAPFVAEALAEASIGALDSIVELAISQGCSFVLFAGDIYDGPERGLRAQLRFRRALEQLSDSGIAAFVVHGNHDPVETGWSAIRSWPGLVTVFSPSEVTSAEVRVNGERVATVQGISYARRDVRENLARLFSRPPGAGLAVGLLHCNVGGIVGHDDYSPCTIGDLRAAGLDYWALGHVHAREMLTGTPGETYAVYSGNTQGRSIHEAERTAKGVMLVSAEGASVTGLEFVPSDSVRFFEVNVDVTGVADLADLCAMLARSADDVLARADGRSLVVRGRITGRGQVHADLAREGSLAGMLRDLREDAGASLPFIWWDNLLDRTRSPLTRTEIERRNDFLSDLLAVADATRRDKEMLRTAARRAVAEAMPPGLRKVAARLAEADEDLERLVAQAADLALDMVADG
jgi:DNA repair exonuclease SbcCD nuclease subunit